MSAVAYVIASPHPDDAAASLGGTIARLVAVDRPVTIVTLCAGRPEGAPSPLARSLHALWGDPPDPVGMRREEDRRAARRLGAGLEFGDLLPAMYRVDARGEPRYGDIFGTPHPDDAGLAEAMAEVLAAAAAARTRVLCPLGARGHVDHVAAADAGRLLLERGVDVGWYDDLPYAADAAARRAACARVGVRGEGAVALEERHVRSKLEALACYASQARMLARDWDFGEALVWRMAADAAPADADFGERVHGLGTGDPVS